MYNQTILESQSIKIKGSQMRNTMYNYFLCLHYHCSTAFVYTYYIPASIPKKLFLY